MRFIFVLLLLMTFVFTLFSQTKTKEEITSDSAEIDTLTNISKLVSTNKITIIKTGIEFPNKKNTAFSVGEKLTFKIRYGFIRAGTATMSVREMTNINDRPVYHIQTTANSSPTFSWIYRVEDVVNSFLDKEGLFSWKFEKRIREGNYKADLSVDYLPADSVAKVEHIRYHDNMEIRKKSNFDIKTPPFVIDILGAFYFVRTEPLDVGKSFFMTNHDNRKVYDLEVRVLGREIIEVEAGKFLCLVVEPLLKGEGIFKNKGRLKVWLTDDKYKLPVLMTTEIVVGHLTTELEKIEGFKDRIPARVVDE